jgi:hypothetical protein
MRTCPVCHTSHDDCKFCNCEDGKHQAQEFDTFIRRRFNNYPEDYKELNREPVELPNPRLTSVLRVNPKAAFGAKKPGAGNVSQLVMMEVAVGMLEGAMKYGRHNYRDNEGISAQTYYDATRRHLDTWYEGENIDPDSNLSHITKAIASLTVLRDAMLTGHFIDDRPPMMDGFTEFKEGLEKQIEKLNKKYPKPKAPIIGKEKR